MSWTPQMRTALQKVLRAHGKDLCPQCGRVLDEDDVDWRGTSTEAGTEGYYVEIGCSDCGREIASRGGWGSLESDQDVIDAVDSAVDD